MAVFVGKSLCSSPVLFQNGFENPNLLSKKIRSFGSHRSSSGLSRTIQSAVDYGDENLHRSVTTTLKNGNTFHEFPKVAFSTIRTEMSAARVEWPEGSNRFFVPVDDMDRIFTTQSIADGLKWEGSTKDLPIKARFALAYKIKSKARKLFAILVQLGKGNIIHDFLEKRIDDNHLPFVRSDRADKSDNYKLYSRLDSYWQLDCTQNWDQDTIIDFAREQWAVDAPVFEAAAEIHHYDFHDNCILPFIKDEARGDNVALGGLSSVWEVVIHPAHQKLYKTSHHGPSFALKRLLATSKPDFDREVKMLKAFTPRNHRNLVKLLCTFCYKREYYLLFPFAESNLRQFWQQHPMPGLSAGMPQWVLLQCKEISSALYLIHEYQTTSEQASLLNITDDDPIFGRHGDIKPENILLTHQDPTETDKVKQQRICLIADFGLMELHRRPTRSLIAPDKINGSPSYEPPELILRKDISRACDIWSLGCVFLELLTWLVLGWSEVEAFTQVRAQFGRNGTPDYKFYTVVTDATAVVRKSVKAWIVKLQIHPNSSPFVADFLDMVFEEMLVIDPTKRIRCGPLNERLAGLKEKAQKDPKYFMKATGLS
ncbi:Protein kinase-like (PK-like) [Glarea lozoyensis ATCC 20868]|uniref:Protein kinase-like (PK-like) n=1 Tax=Glarea lozoyensis (strain ATCC 20868 / MF5171) TaxID=1116229 RepID=S3CYJ5_GLAL2|nr:Protein kinase-like (PK-like) [Glarea lozoyensis ATCC 20868]EPE24891.1 Protein kinase-like (PK-like) [Glarea lozoyensis ATCC 20868]